VVFGGLVGVGKKKLLEVVSFLLPLLVVVLVGLLFYVFYMFGRFRMCAEFGGVLLRSGVCVVG
jgi:hypothetical protein